MTRIQAQAFTGGNVFIDGNGYVGLLKDFEPPKFEFETIEANASIGKYERVLPVLKSLGAKLTFQALGADIFKALDRSKIVKVVVKNNVSGADNDGLPKEIQVEATMQGAIKTCELSKAEMNKEVEISFEMSILSFKYVVDREEMLSYDSLNSTFKVAGVDQYAAINRNIS